MFYGYVKLPKGSANGCEKKNKKKHNWTSWSTAVLLWSRRKSINTS